MRLIVIIPARSGSKGVVNKNITVVNGKPLLHWAIESAFLHCKPTDIIVSTDSEEYLVIARTLLPGASSLRPSQLSTSKSKIVDVISYEIRSRKPDFGSSSDDVVLLLEPSFFGARCNVGKALRVMSEGRIDFCLGVEPVPLKYHADKQIYTDAEFDVQEVKTDNVNRQELGKSWIRSGEFYLFRAENITKRGQMMIGSGLAFATQGAYVNIDDRQDLKRAQRIVPGEWTCGVNS